MVDLSTRNTSRKVQRSVHLDDDTSKRLDDAAALSGSTRSQLLTRLIWEDLKLPGDNPPDPNQAELALDAPAAVAVLREEAPVTYPEEEDIDLDH